MIDAFQDLYRSIENQRNTIRFQAKDRINQISDDLASIISHISLNKAENRPANDLLDKFDLLVDELSTYGNVKVYHRENGTISVYLGTDELVRNDIAKKLHLNEGTNLQTGEFYMHLGWNQVGNPISGLQTGSLNAMMDLKDVILPGYLKQLDELVVQIANAVNDVHLKGYNHIAPAHSGSYFFSPDVKGVMSFSLSKEVLTSTDFISTSLTGASGDNQVALMITDLRLAQIFGGQTLTESFADVVYNIASDVRMTKMSAERSTLLTQQTDNFRESVKGVSMNEETANLMKFQQSLQAASKIISVADEMFKTIIGMLR
jgi:flagellar hook-associated protein 1 FlgK